MKNTLHSLRNQQICLFFIKKSFAFCLLLGSLLSFNSFAQAPFITTWKTDNPGTSNSTSITIPTTGSGYLYDVDWNNDGVFDQFGITGNVTRNYGVAGTYTVAIRGSFPRIYFNNGGDKSKILSIEQWGGIAWTNMNAAFFGCNNLAGNPSDVPNLSGVTDMSFMFYVATAFNQNIGNWNVSSVTNMSFMFYGASAFNQNIGNWNVNSVTNMASMFQNASAFNQNIGTWNVSAVTNMASMFRRAIAFNQNIGNWNVSAVTNMSFMFLGASVFNQSIGAWNVSAVTNMANMFYEASTFNQNIGTWNVGAVTSMFQMFIRATAFNQNIGAWNVGAVTDMTNIFNAATAFNQNIGAWNITNATSITDIFNNSGISRTNYDNILIAWNTAGYANKNLGNASPLTYCAGQTARTNLTTIRGWTITGDSYNCPIAAEMDIKGNSVSIVDGDITPSTGDHTDFGSQSVASGNIVRIFTIENTGTGALTLSGTPKVVISGTNAADFTVTTQPTSPVAATNGTTTFAVTFDPSASGVRTASISIANDDTNENPYNFSIQGMGITPSTCVQGWQFEGSRSITGSEANYPVLNTNASNTSYVLFNDSQNGNKASVMSFDGTNWIYVGARGFSNLMVIQRGDIAFDNLGKPWVVLTTNESTSGFFKLEVWTFDGTNWINVSPNVGQGVGIEPKIAFNNGNPFITFGEPNTNGGGISVMTYNGSTWSYVGLPRFTSQNSYPGGLAFFNDQPYVSFADQAVNGRASVMKYNGTSWNFVGPQGFSAASGGGFAFWADLEISPSGVPYISYIDNANNGVNVMKFDSPNWVQVGLVNLTTAFWIGLEFNGSDPYIGFQDLPAASKASVMSFDGTSWQYVDGQGFTTTAAYAESLNISNGTIKIAYIEGTAQRGVTVMKNCISKPEINIKGNSVSIADGDIIPSTGDHTDFGSQSVASGNIVRIFTIENTGTGALTLSGTPKVVISGTNAADFTVTTQPTSPVAATNGTTTFAVTFDPSASGIRTASISIANDDANENPYNFDITGEGVQIVTPVLTAAGNTTFFSGGSVTLTSSAVNGNQWYKDGNLLIGAINQTYVATTSGNYAVVVTSGGFQSSPSNAIIVTVNANYSVTTTDGALVITDLAGNGETLEVTQNGTNINFNATGRTFSLNGGTVTPLPIDVAKAGLTSITINTTAGDDIIKFSNYITSMPSLTVNGGAGDDQVYSLGGGITFLPNANLDLDLTNDASPGDKDEVLMVEVSNNILSFFTLSGTGTAIVKVSKSVYLGTRCSITTQLGDLTVEGNWAGTTSGNFTGVTVGFLGKIGINTFNNLGTGQVIVRGKGGDTDDNNHGVIIASSGGVIEGGKTGTALIKGIGGPSAGNSNYGVLVATGGSSIGSDGSNVVVEGTGGGIGTSFGNAGVYIWASASISAGGAGILTVAGTGGSSNGSSNHGITVIGGIGSAIGGGDVIINGTKGANSNAVDVNVTNTGNISGRESITVNSPTGGFGPNNLGLTFTNASTTKTSTFATDAKFNYYVGGPTRTGATAGQYFPLQVVGLLDLNNVGLVTSGAYVPISSNEFLVVINDGTDAVRGKFKYNGLVLNEGDQVPNFRGSTVPFYISYVGGDGNDVAFKSLVSEIKDVSVSLSSICAGTSINVTFTTSITFGSGNQFNVLLSDKNGSFDNSPPTIGTTTSARSILCTIPINAVGGESYRIKIVSTTPIISGNSNPVPLTIHPQNLPLVSPTNDYSAGNKTKKAIQSISATNKVISPANVIYQAGNAIMLNAGFEARSGTVFKAEIAGCN